MKPPPGRPNFLDTVGVIAVFTAIICCIYAITHTIDKHGLKGILEWIWLGGGK